VTDGVNGPVDEGAAGRGARGGGLSSPCGDVIAEVYLYLDLECSETRRSMIAVHLEQCGSCLREYGIEQEVRALVARCCGAERAPDELRERLRHKLSQLADTDSAPG